VEHVARLAPKLIEEVFPRWFQLPFSRKSATPAEESVHIRISGPSSNPSPNTPPTITDPTELARRVRVALSPAIVQQIYGPRASSMSLPLTRRWSVFWCKHWAMPAPGTGPGCGGHAQPQCRRVALKQEEIGLPACLLVPDAIRNSIARLVRRVAPRLQVLAHSEIPDTHTIRIGPILRGATS